MPLLLATVHDSHLLSVLNNLHELLLLCYLGLEEEQKVSFYDHVFLEKKVQEGNWCPSKGSIRLFMASVATALSMNPYLTVQEKHEHINWFRAYFTEKLEILKELDVEFGSAASSISWNWPLTRFTVLSRDGLKKSRYQMNKLAVRSSAWSEGTEKQGSLPVELILKLVFNLQPSSGWNQENNGRKCKAKLCPEFPTVNKKERLDSIDVLIDLQR